jgi:hypothetical protein
VLFELGQADNSAEKEAEQESPMPTGKSGGGIAQRMKESH